MQHKYKFTSKDKENNFVWFCENCYKVKKDCIFDTELCNGENGDIRPLEASKGLIG